MHKFYKASYDASIYLQQPEHNAGLDEILEIGKVFYGDTRDVYRTLIKFDITDLSASFVSGYISPNSRVYVNLKSARSEGIPLEYTIYANAISESWDMGSGTKFDGIITGDSPLSGTIEQGVSWRYRNGINKWQENTFGGTAVYRNGTTGSANAEGGVWYTASQASQHYNYEYDDVRMNVTDIVKMWISGSIINNGLILRHSLKNEEDHLDYGALKFFSKETNTIYEPKLEVVWDDSSFNTGSLEPVTGSAEEDYKVVLANFKTSYPKDAKVKIKVKGRDKYPQKSFGTTFEYDQSKYLPVTTYYQLEDYITGEIVFPFGEYTKVSCDETSNYFIMDLATLPMKRTYRLKLKIVENGISTIIDDKLIFEIKE
jgi:hypothetical protein